MKHIEIYTTPTCPYCQAAKLLLRQKKVTFTEINVSGDPNLRQRMGERTNGRRSVPQIFIGDRHIGGCDDLHALEEQNALDKLLAE